MTPYRKGNAGAASSKALLGRVFLLVLIAVLPALLILTLLGLEQRRRGAAEAQREALRVARALAAEETEFIESTRTLLEVLVHLPPVHQRTAECDEILAEILEREPLYANLGVIELDGRPSCSALPFDPGLNLSDRAYFRLALRDRRFAIGDYQIGRITGRPTVNAAQPLFDDEGALTGVAFAALDLAWLDRASLQAHARNGTVVAVFDRRGTVLARQPDPDRWVGRTVAESALFQSARFRREGTTEIDGLDGTRRLYGFSVLGSRTTPNAFLSVGIPADVAYAEANRFLTLSLTGLALGTALALMAAWFFGRAFVVTPVQRALEAQRQSAVVSARLAAIVDSSDDAIVGKTLDGNITSWNRGAERLYGHTAEEAVGRNIEILLPADRRDEERDLLQRVGRGEHVEHFDTRRLCKSGEVRDVSLTISPIHGADGRVEGASAIARDASERKRAEATLRASEKRYADAFRAEQEAVERLRELDALKNEFVAMVAHDLRSPMAVLAGYSDTLQQRWHRITEEQREQFLATIGRTARHLGDMVEQTLQIARIESGDFQYDIAPFDLSELVERTVGEVAGPQGTDRFRIQRPPELPRALGDEHRQWQILTNLLSNAVKFSPPDSPVDISISAVDDHLRVDVRDRGMGIDPADMPKLFGRFSRLAQPTGDGSVKGTGLGLYICKRMIEAQGGTIQADSTPGEGSTFSYTIPTANEAS